MILDGVAYGTENDTFLGKLFLKSGLHRHRVHDGIDSHAAQRETLLERYAEFVEGFHQFGIDLFFLLFLLLCQGVSIIGDSLIVNRGHCDVSPFWFLHRCPMAECFQAKLKHPFRLAFLLRDEPHDIFVQSFFYYFCMYVGGESVLIFLFCHLTYKCIFF